MLIHTGKESLPGDYMAEKEKKGDMSVKDAGHKGGEKTAETHGREFYEEIGHKGGEKTAETHGKEFYEQIGHKGGEKGGQRVKELIDKGKETKR
jgi:hypothetical protein